MAGFHTQVSLAGFPFPDHQLVVKLSGTIVAADIGKALTQDTTADNTMKLAGDGDPIDGQLLTLESRTIEGQTIGTCGFKFASKLPVKSGLTGAAIVARGSYLVGAGAGEVKAADLATLASTPTAAGVVLVAKIVASAPRCWAVSSLLATATKL